MRRRVRPLLQMEATECGAASLAMVLAWHRCHVPMEELRQECGVSRDGSKASNLIKAAGRYGLEANAYKKEPAQLAALPFPQIIHWNFNHFVVLEALDARRVQICDPAYGRRSLRREELDQAFTGVVLTFSRASDYRPRGSRPGLRASLGAYLKGWGASLGGIFALGLLFALPGLVIPLIAKEIVDQVLVPGRGDWLAWLLGALVLMGAARALFSAWKDAALLKLGTHLATSSSQRLLRHLFELPFSFFTQRLSGEIAQRITLNDPLARALTGALASSFVDAVLAVLFLALLALQSPVLALVSVASAGLMILSLGLASGAIKDVQLRLQKDQGQVDGVGLSGIRMIETIKSMAREGEFLARIAGFHANQLLSEQESGRRSGTLVSVLAFLAGVNTVVVLLVGGAGVLAGSLSLGTLIAAQSLSASFLQPVLNLSQLGTRIQQCALSLARVDDVLHHPLVSPSPVEPPGVFRKLRGEVRLEGVCFSYSRLEPPLIKDLSLKLEAGQRVALVGGSGSGKSTVAKLLAGLFVPDAGRILIDGEELASFPRAVLARSLAMVDQDVVFFEGSLFDNLTLRDPSITEAAVVQAAHDAAIHEEILARPGGYQCRVEEGGRNFSGGQRQRLEIARALAREPAILILDEATSALDTLTEATVEQNLRRRGCATLVVAHRLSTIRDSDEILVLDAGVAVERGPHNALMAAGGVYAHLMGSENAD